MFAETEHGLMMAHVGTRPVVAPGYPPPAYGLSITPNAADSQAEGTLRLASADPSALPVIDPRYQSDTGGQDLAVLVEALRASLAEPLLAVIGTARRDGTVALNPVWFDHRDDELWLNSYTSAQWPKRLRASGERPS